MSDLLERAHEFLGEAQRTGGARWNSGSDKREPNHHTREYYDIYGGPKYKDAGNASTTKDRRTIKRAMRRAKKSGNTKAMSKLKQRWNKNMISYD